MKKIIMGVVSTAMIFSASTGVFASTLNNCGTAKYFLTGNSSVAGIRLNCNNTNKENCGLFDKLCENNKCFTFNCNTNCNNNNNCKPNGNGSGNENVTPDEKPDTTPDEKPDIKPDEKPDEKPDTKPDEKPDTKPDEKPDEKPDTTPDEKPDEKPDTTPDEKPDEKPDTTPDEKPDEKPDTTPDEKPDTKPDDNNNQGNNSGTDSNASLSAYEQEVLNLVNKERAAQGLSALKSDSGAQAAAELRASEVGSYFSHTRPDGRAFNTALSDVGASYRGAGENIAKGQRTPEEVVNAWMNSEGHRANILNSKYTHLGVGCVKNGSSYSWVQIFTY